MGKAEVANMLPGGRNLLASGQACVCVCVCVCVNEGASERGRVPGREFSPQITGYFDDGERKCERAKV